LISLMISGDEYCLWTQNTNTSAVPTGRVSQRETTRPYVHETSKAVVKWANKLYNYCFVFVATRAVQIEACEGMLTSHVRCTKQQRICRWCDWIWPRKNTSRTKSSANSNRGQRLQPLCIGAGRQRNATLSRCFEMYESRHFREECCNFRVPRHAGPDHLGKLRALTVGVDEWKWLTARVWVQILALKSRFYCCT
jgi:hypothetical protein